MAIEEDLSEWEIASTKKMVAYAFGYVVVNALVNLGGMFYFYEVEVGLPVVYVMAAIIIFGIWNMVNDPLFGYLTDRPLKWTKKYGLRAPWIIITAFPVLILYIFIYAPPFGASVLIIFLWLVVTTCAFDTIFSIYNDHVYGGFVNQFPSEYERRKAFSIAALFVGGLLACLGILSLFIIQWGKPETFLLNAIIIAIILGVFNIILFFGIRESEEMKEMFLKGFEKAEKKGFIGTMKTSLKTKNFAISLAGYTTQITAMWGLWEASSYYMYKDVYGVDPTAGILPTLVAIAGFLGFIPFWSNYARKHGFKKTYYMCFILHGLAFIPFLFTQNIIQHTIFVFFLYLFYSGEAIVSMPVASDTYDEVASRMEKRVDATLVGIRTFFFRLAFIVQAAVIGMIHILTIYDPNPAAIQSSEAIWGIRIHAALIPAIMYVIMGLIFWKYYTLEGTEKEELVRKLKDLGIYR